MIQIRNGPGHLQNPVIESSRRIRQRVIEARTVQEERFRNKQYSFNGDMDTAELERFCELGGKEKRLMELAYRQLDLSARTYHRVLKVARTIADQYFFSSGSLQRHLFLSGKYPHLHGFIGTPKLIQFNDAPPMHPLKQPLMKVSS